VITNAYIYGNNPTIPYIYKVLSEEEFEGGSPGSSGASQVSAKRDKIKYAENILQEPLPGFEEIKKTEKEVEEYNNFITDNFGTIANPDEINLPGSNEHLRVTPKEEELPEFNKIDIDEDIGLIIAMIEATE
jgi:hypothetical protein